MFGVVVSQHEPALFFFFFRRVSSEVVPAFVDVEVYGNERSDLACLRAELSRASWSSTDEVSNCCVPALIN